MGDEGGGAWALLRGALDAAGGLAGLDPAVLEYAEQILEDEDLEAGEDGEGLYEAVGELLLEACEGRLGEAEVRGACGAAGAALAARMAGSAPSSRVLAEGVTIGEQADAVVEDFAALGRPGGTSASPAVVQAAGPVEMDAAKLRRRKKKEERAAAAAEERLRSEAAAEMGADAPRVIRNAGGPGRQDIRLESLAVSNGGAWLIRDAKLTLAHGRRYGLVGRNGTGKTTLMRAISTGQVHGIPPHVQVLHVEQEVAGDDTTVIDCVLECDGERSDLLAEEKEIQRRDAGPGVSEEQRRGHTARLAEIYQKLEEIDAFSAEARAATILSGLSFDEKMMKMRTRDLSGGWRMRVSLARAIFVQPDLLMLDEPTNHLDLHAVIWLEDCLRQWGSTLFIVSHARDFLNTVCTDIIHLQNCELTTYKGGYDDFEKARHEKQLQASKQAEAQERRKKHVQAFVDRFRYNAKRASMVQSRIKALERMVDIKGVMDDPEYCFNFPDPGTIPPPIITMNDVSFAYPGAERSIFQRLNFGLDMDSRVAVVGKNGVGKSTLLNLIVGALEASQGHVFRNHKVRVAAFTQHHIDTLDFTATPLTHMRGSFPGVKEQDLRAHLGAFGISGNLGLQQIRTLSGGQKSRVALAKLTWNKPHMLLLDEPSNHLDMDAVDALIQALAIYKGGVLLISHDSHLIRGVTDELWKVEKGEVTVFHGGFDEYRKTCLE